MKKLTILLFAVMATLAFASTPTVTLSSRTTYNEGTKHGYVVYEYTWSQSVTSGDTVILGPWDIGGLLHADSLVTVEFHSTETSSDSVNYDTQFQFSSKASPNTGSSSKDWVTVFTDTSNPETFQANYGASPRRKTQSRKMRIILVEAANNGIVPATITNTVRVIIPLSL